MGKTPSAARLQEPPVGPEELREGVEVEAEAEVDAQFNLFEDMWPITACSPDFASLIGLPASEIKLLDLVADAEAFVAKTQSVFNKAYHHYDFTAFELCADVHFKLPRSSARNRVCSFHAACDLTMEHNRTIER